MLKKINISGFKAFASQSIDLAPVTLLCGRNNSGKSSVLQALRMFCNSVENHSPLIEGLGTIKDLRSKFVRPNDSIIIECEFRNNIIQNLTLAESGFNKPSFAPVTIALSAERLGPRVSLPLESEFKQRPSIGIQGEHVLGFLEDLRNCIVDSRLHHEDAQGATLAYQCAAWLKEIAPGASFFYEVERETDSSRMTFDSFRPTNVGFGLSYSLPVVAAILGASSHNLDNKPWENLWDETWDKARTTRGILLIIENPEAHLHPSAQTAMGRLIARAGRAGLQIVVETQSEHIMDGVRLEEKFFNSKKDKQDISGDSLDHVSSDGLVESCVVFNYFSRSEDGRITVDSPKLLDSGKLSHWPAGFFDQALKNRLQLVK